MLQSFLVALAALAVAASALGQTFETPVPLGADLRTVRVARTEVFAPGARIDVVGLDGTVRSHAPDDAYFVGALAGDPDSTAVMAVGPGGTRGFVAGTDGAWWIGRDGVGVPLPAADGTAGCGGADDPPSGDADDAVRPRALALPGADFPPSMLLLVDLAIETNYELWQAFGADQPTIDYLTALVAQANVAFARDLHVHMRISYLRLWQTPADPWTGADSLTELSELRAYWRSAQNDMDAIAGPRDVVHLVSGRGFSENIAGRAFLDTLCNENAGYGYTRTAGRTNPSDAVQTFTHELGHSLGSPHSHCYVPPLDKCYGGENGVTCYDGPNVASVGTIMSYCHSFGNGRTLDFHPATVGLIRSRIAGADCLAPLCAEVDAHPEYCDDGDVCTVDGCDETSGCTHVAVPGCCHDAADCADGSDCTDDVCNAANRCEHAPHPDGAPCSADLCHPRSCRAGACTDDAEPGGYDGLACGLEEIDSIISLRRDAMRPAARTSLRNAWRAAFRHYRTAGKAHAKGNGIGELRAMNRLAKSLRKLAKLVARFEHRGSLQGPVVVSLRAALGDAQRSTSGLQASLASSAP